MPPPPRRRRAQALADGAQEDVVERRPHPSDRRRLVVVPTEHAVREAGAALQPLVDGLEAVAGDFTADEQAVVLRYLERAAASLRAYAPPEDRT